MIRIIKYTYGYKKGNTIIPKTAVDAPFSCDAKEEARLVKLGIAEYVNDTADEADEVDDEKLYTDKTPFAELKEIAKLNGATDEDLKPLKSKVQVMELIDKLIAGADDKADEADEAAPEFNAVDGVAG